MSQSLFQQILLQVLVSLVNQAIPEDKEVMAVEILKVMEAKTLITLVPSVTRIVRGKAKENVFISSVEGI